MGGVSHVVLIVNDVVHLLIVSGRVHGESADA